ncbi:MAG TPA: hypothetical protein VF824_07000 [Thermoanaerobaculia bacterium]|jgi:hypothetical protein
MSELESVSPAKTPRKSADKKKMAARAMYGGVVIATAVAYASKRAIGNKRIIVPDNARLLSAQERGRKKSPSAKFERIVANSLTAQEAGARLGSSAAAVKKQIRNGSLYGFAVGTTWYVPSVQFDGEKLVAGLDRVVSRMRRDLHPIEVVNWFTTASSDLVINSRNVTPLTWLKHGGDVDKVANLAEELGSGI